MYCTMHVQQQTLRAIKTQRLSLNELSTMMELHFGMQPVWTSKQNTNVQKEIYREPEGKRIVSETTRQE